ncbi:unknown [Eubacterium sp. CAG:192]|nr:unknown [Eubacterium sp. CAG:192]
MVRRKKSVCIAIVMILSILFSTNNQAYANNTENEITNIA